MAKGALNVDKAIWELYEQIPHLLVHPPYGEKGRYIAYYVAKKLYLVFDLWYHGFFLVEADSPKNAIENVNCDRLKYIPKESEDVAAVKEHIEQPTSDDCVSRQAVHNMLEDIPIVDTDKWFNWLQKACLRLADMPPVTPTHCIAEVRFSKDDLREICNERIESTHGTCKDCKHRTAIYADGDCFCEKDELLKPSTFYCADFEKRGNENE
jgi:hypothetical protein